MKRTVLMLACLAGLSPMPASAELEARVVVSAYQYFPGGDDFTVTAGEVVLTPLVIRRGSPVLFINADVNRLPHTMTSDDVGSAGDPLFDSGLTVPDRTASVGGIQTLAPGLYGFHCELHDWTMHGWLRVV